MADRDLVFVAADEHFADDKPQEPLLILDAELVETGAEAGEEAFERVRELEVGLGVVQLAVKRGLSVPSWPGAMIPPARTPRMQLRLKLAESPAPAAALWELVGEEQRQSAMALLAALLARTVAEVTDAGEADESDRAAI